MALTRRIARPLLASIFVAEGIGAVRDPGPRAKAAQAVTVPLARQFPSLPDDPEQLVRLNGAVQVGAGVLLAVGRFRRLAAVALIVSIVPTTYAGHRFWEEDDDISRAQQRAHFLKNVGLLGGLVLAATDTEGAPSLGWRARRRAADVGAALGAGRAAGTSSAVRAGSSLADGAAALAHNAHDAAGAVGRRLDHGTVRTSRRARRVAARAARRADATGRHLADVLPATGQQVADTLTGAGQRAADSLGQAARAGTEAVAPYLAAGTDRAGELVERVQELVDR